MSRKRGKKPKAAVEAVPDDILAEGSGPVGGGARAGTALGADAIATVEDVVTTADIATTEDVVTADDVVATAEDSAQSEDSSQGRGTMRAADATALQPNDGATDTETTPSELDALGMAVASGLDLSDAAGGDGDDRSDDGNCGGDGGDGGEDDADGGGDGDDESDDEAAIVFPTSAAGMDATQLKHLVEALVFASDRPLTVQRLRQLTRVSEVRRLEQALAEIAEDYRERGLLLQQVSGGYQFRTRTQFSPWVQQLIAGRPVRLSRAQLETLAIIAYRQPITRPEIDDIRGVDSSATLKLLIDRMLIRVLGKREEVGRPILYGTTKEFLDFFSLGDLRELPTLREYSELTAESRKVMSDRLGIEPDGASSDADLTDAVGHPAGHVGADGANRNGTNGHGANDHGANDHGANRHGANGHSANDHPPNGHSANEHDANERTAYGRGSDIHGASEHDANEHSAYGRSSNVHGENEQGANEHDAYGHGSDMHGENEQGANEHDAYGEGSNVHGANEQRANEHGANEQSANEHDANEHSANEHDANEHSAYGRSSNVHGANAQDANEQGANEHDAYGRGSDMHGANEQGANEHDAYGRGSDMHGANEHGANEHGANEHSANEHSANEQDQNGRGAKGHAPSDADANGRGANERDAYGRGEHGADEHGAKSYGAYEHSDDPLDNDGAAGIASAMDLAEAAAPLLSADEATEPPTAINASELGGNAGDVEAASASDAEPGAD